MKRIALAVAIALVPLPGLSGTTGSLTGRIVSAEDGAPIANAKVTVISGAQVETTRTDSHGNFAFISLSPDIYSVSVDRVGYQPVLVAEVPVFADASVQLPLMLAPVLVFIIHHRDSGPDGLIKPGTVANTYSYSPSRLSLFPPVNSNMWALRMTPGITFGAGAPVTH